MTKYSKESLEKLLVLVGDICKDEDNVWFKESIGKINSDSIRFSELKNIHDDLRRTKSFLKYIDGQYWREGFNFYKKIPDVNLKIALTSDYKEMRIAESEKDYMEFVRRIILQFENVLNYLITKFDAHDIIYSNTQSYKNDSLDLYTGPYGFFEPNGARKDLAKIGLPSKLNWARIFFNVSYSFPIWNDLTFLRNKASHRGSLSSLEVTKMEKIIDAWDQQKINTFYSSLLKNLIVHI